MPNVRMDHVLVGNAKDLPSVQSTGAGPCLVLVLFDRQTKTAALAHISSSTDIARAMVQIYSQLAAQGAPTSRLEARIYGGWLGFSEKTLAGIEAQLRLRQIPVLEKDVLGDIGFRLNDYLGQATRVMSSSCKSCIDDSIKNIEFNLSTGEAYNVVPQTCTSTTGPRQTLLPFKDSLAPK